MTVLQLSDMHKLSSPFANIKLIWSLTDKDFTGKGFIQSLPWVKMAFYKDYLANICREYVSIFQKGITDLGIKLSVMICVISKDHPFL